jgi:predicted lipid-binding transport protein (Tim44 family)
MDGGFQFLDIILIALIAAFFILRLRNVLGRREGHRGPPDLPTPGKPDAEQDKVVPLPSRRPQQEDAVEGEPLDVEPAAADGPLAAGLTQIRIADRAFNTEEFMSGSRIAFEIIVTAFAAGDVGTLKRFLSPEVYNNFAQTIREREQSGEVQETTVVSLREAELVEAYMAGRTAHLTVKFVSEQITCMRNESGDVVDGDPEKVNEVTDFWTFARDTRSTDPNWTLVATGSLD